MIIPPLLMRSDPPKHAPHSEGRMTAALPVPSLDFLGLRLSDVGLSAAAALIAARDPDAPFAYVVTPNAQHMVRLAQDSGAWRKAYEKAWLVLSDGNVVPRLARLIHGLTLPQASGSDLTVAMLRDHIRADDPVTVIGGGDTLKRALEDRFKLSRLSVYDPPFGFIRDPAAVEACLQFIETHPARYIFLAVGAPQSELLGRAAVERGTLHGVALCIGGSLLFATGLISRAPVWVQKAGLEGIYRLMQKPRSHFRRVFVESLPVVWIILRARFGGRGILPR
jgi:N-acetylglucosaminyldiphosphoundecaprenol N-acetyl-beta-D-mannosaminyltransferase